jgi:YHS domain-containing protein
MKNLLLILLITLPASIAFAQSEALRNKHFNLDDNVALDGYDPVSYFTSSPTEGQKKLAHIYNGVTYLFASPQNLKTFKASPEKYEPMYGGWCAYAMGKNGEKVKVDPQTFKIVDGRLYMFYNFWGNNTLEDWNEKETPLKAAADLNWKKLFH